MLAASKTDAFTPIGSDDARSHTSVLLLVVMTISIIPIPLYGTLYIAEFVFVVLAICSIRPKAKLPMIPLLAVLLAFVSVAYFLVGMRGDNIAAALTNVRAMIVLAAVTFVLVNRPELAVKLREALPAFGVVLTVLIVLENRGYLFWPGQSIGQAGFVGDSLRVVGPLGPGPTSAILLCALYMSLRRGRTLLVLIVSVGLLIPVSRAHYIGAALMLIVMLVSPFRRYFWRILAVAAFGASFVLFSDGVSTRIAGIVEGKAGEDRTELWGLAVRQFSPVGHGPAGFHFQETLTTSAAYPHNQYLLLLAYYGLTGVGFTVLLAWAILRVAKPHRPLLLGLAASCIFGEFVVGPTPALCIGSIAAWIVVLAPHPAWPGRNENTFDLHHSCRNLEHSGPIGANESSSRRPVAARL